MPKRRMKRHAVTQPQDPSYRLIPLTQGQNAIVDAADFEWLSQWNWCASWNSETKSFYALRRAKNGPNIRMAREILQCGPREEGDHENHDTLDNRRHNLRVASSSQNKCNRRRASNNTSHFIGVTWNGFAGKWQAQIGIGGHSIYLGLFLRKDDAARTYDEAAKKYHGEFAQFNFS